MQEGKMLFWTLTVFSLAIDTVWAYHWQDIYGLLIYDEGKNLINSSRTEVFFHSFILVNSILIFIIKVGQCDADHVHPSVGIRRPRD